MVGNFQEFLMIGWVVSKGKSFGFIQNEVGAQYYFNPRLVELGVPYGSLEVGSEVFFNPKTKPRGLRAHSVRHLDKRKNPFYYEPGAFYAERIGKSRLVFRIDQEPTYIKERRLHSLLEMRSPAHTDFGLGYQAFYRAVCNVGANLIYDTHVITSEVQVDGREVTVYEWRAKVGVYVEPKKVGSQHEMEKINGDTERSIESRMLQLVALQQAIDMEHATHPWRPEGSTVCPPKSLDQAQKRLPEDSLEMV